MLLCDVPVGLKSRRCPAVSGFEAYSLRRDDLMLAVMYGIKPLDLGVSVQSLLLRTELNGSVLRRGSLRW